MRSHFRACMRALTLAVLSSLFLPASICSGQTKPGDMVVDVPFAFTVGEKGLPPGHYIVTSMNETTLRMFNGKQGVIFTIHSVRGEALEGSGKMVFSRYGDKYFLSQLWQPANSTGKQLFPSKIEKEITDRSSGETAKLEIKTY